jgi:hypothetical protein
MDGDGDGDRELVCFYGIRLKIGEEHEVKGGGLETKRELRLALEMEMQIRERLAAMVEIELITAERFLWY